jgi:hypothetical protein
MEVIDSKGRLVFLAKRSHRREVCNLASCRGNRFQLIRDSVYSNTCQLSLIVLTFPSNTCVPRS